MPRPEPRVPSSSPGTTHSISIATATRATYAAFIGSGFALASWASRIPQVRDRLQLGPSRLGLVLLALAAGSLVSLPLAGMLVQRAGARRTVAGMAVLLGAGLATVAVGYAHGVAPVLLGLLVVGFANGAWDVAMNVHGAAVERRLGRAIMPRFHAGYSLGTVAGALLGALMVAARVAVTLHLLAVAALVACAIPLAARGFVVAAANDERSSRPDPSSRTLPRWREPRTVLVGLVVLAFAFTEGSGNDWIGVALIDGYHAPAALGTLGLAAFLAAMTTLRWFGTRALDRYGRVAVLRALAALASVGLALFVLGPSTPFAFAGALLWGAGAALGFPVGMSAAADEPAAAAGRVSVVASIGYCAFLGGPPVIGFLGDHVGTRRALLAVGVLLALAVVPIRALRPLPARG